MVATKQIKIGCHVVSFALCHFFWTWNTFYFFMIFLKQCILNWLNRKKYNIVGLSEGYFLDTRYHKEWLLIAVLYCIELPTLLFTFIIFPVLSSIFQSMYMTIINFLHVFSYVERYGDVKIVMTIKNQNSWK